ncbi:MAG: hypothetical protein QOI41_6693 [Myxococcales bacterium]|nr:hypothetical protein [Myxococcales bacterium]
MEMSRKWTRRSGKWLAGAALLTAAGAAGTGCLSRPVGTQPPTTKVNFTSTVSQQSVDKVDLLFMIDNSASMGDKQTILADAVPNLLVGLLKPKCVDPATGVAGAGAPSADPKSNKANRFGCPMGTEPEFAPVTDMHIGIVSSSLGSFGGDVCPDKNPRQNDHGHLVNIGMGGTPVPEASPSNFLAWYPQNDENSDKVRHPDPPVTPFGDTTTLSAAFGKLVTGIGQNGCGLEAQMESWYHFLIQPDPWVKITVDGNNKADLGGPADIDVDLLAQRADFLRPDSLVAVILLTDEDDSSVDPLSVGGQGWAFMSNQFPGSPVFRSDGLSTTAPRGTSACDKDPGSPDCTSCGFAATCNASDPACAKIKNDPNCLEPGTAGDPKTAGYYAPAADQLNSRFSQQLMKRNYGIDPQYPISRYTDGLSKTKVPDRTTEHLIKVNGTNRDIGGYLGTGKCTNPLFAAKLPHGAGEDFCNLPRGTRTPDLVFFAVVGGVPNNLLHFDPADPEKSRITSDDWVKILGQEPGRYNYTGLDPHMVESKGPRMGLPAPSQTRGDNGSDPVHGREWDTGGNDLQYACTFELPDVRTCTAQDTSCDCADTKNPPLCGATSGQQRRAKAYPTVREFMAVRALGDQGVIASLCPITLKGDKQNPSYGYNPAVKAIVDRLKNALTTQCLPQKLTRDTSTNEVPCLVLAQLGEVTDSCDAQGLKKPDPAILEKFLEQQKVESGDVKDGGTDLSKLPVCQLPQLVVAAGQTCKDDQGKGWCYVENGSGASPAGRCPQALIFSAATGALAGAKFSLQCIQQFNPGQAAGDTTGQP